jgi:hypothetical protein
MHGETVKNLSSVFLIGRVVFPEEGGGGSLRNMSEYTVA